MYYMSKAYFAFNWENTFTKPDQQKLHILDIFKYKVLNTWLKTKMVSTKKGNFQSSFYMKTSQFTV